MFIKAAQITLQTEVSYIISTNKASRICRANNNAHPKAKQWQVAL